MTLDARHNAPAGETYESIREAGKAILSSNGLLLLEGQGNALLPPILVNEDNNNFGHISNINKISNPIVPYNTPVLETDKLTSTPDVHKYICNENKAKNCFR